jgi:RNA polymerase sigma-B factor
MTAKAGLHGVDPPHQRVPADNPQISDDDRSRLTAELLGRCGTADAAEQERLRSEVVVLNMEIARAIALRYRGRGVAVDDLVQVAYVGLVKAVNGYDPAHEKDFLSYAVPTVTGEVKRYFRDFGWTVRPPRRIQELQGHISRASHDMAQQLGRSPRPSEVAERLGIDVENVIEALASDGAFTPASLDVPVGEGSAVLGDLIGEDDRDLVRAEMRLALGPAVRQLDERDRRILELRFFEGWTQERIAQDIGVTQMQVSRLLARILSDLRTELT